MAPYIHITHVIQMIQKAEVYNHLANQIKLCFHGVIVQYGDQIIISRRILSVVALTVFVKTLY